MKKAFKINIDQSILDDLQNRIQTRAGPMKLKMPDGNMEQMEPT